MQRCDVHVFTCGFGLYTHIMPLMAMKLQDNALYELLKSVSLTGFSQVLYRHLCLWLELIAERASYSLILNCSNVSGAQTEMSPCQDSVYHLFGGNGIGHHPG